MCQLPMSARNQAARRSAPLPLYISRLCVESRPSFSFIDTDDKVYATTFLSSSLTACWMLPGDVFQRSSCELFMREGGEKGNSTRERKRERLKQAWVRAAWLTLLPIRHWPLCSEALPREFSLPASRSNSMPFLFCQASLFPHRHVFEAWGLIWQKWDLLLV